MLVVSFFFFFFVFIFSTNKYKRSKRESKREAHVFTKYICFAIYWNNFSLVHSGNEMCLCNKAAFVPRMFRLAQKIHKIQPRSVFFFWFVSVFLSLLFTNFGARCMSQAILKPVKVRLKVAQHKIHHSHFWFELNSLIMEFLFGARTHTHSQRHISLFFITLFSVSWLLFNLLMYLIEFKRGNHYSHTKKKTNQCERTKQ